MATTVVASERNASRATVVGFGRPPYSLPVQPAPLLRWALLALVVANVGRIPLLSTGGRDATIVLNDLCVVGLASFCIIAAVLRRSLLIDWVAFFAIGFAAVGL